MLARLAQLRQVEADRAAAAAAFEAATTAAYLADRAALPVRVTR